MMMQRSNSKPAWWVLYTLVALMIVGLVLTSFDGLPAWANEIAAIGIIILVFGGMMVWLRLNSAQLWNEELRNLNLDEFKVLEYPLQELCDMSPDEHDDMPTIAVK